MEPEALFSTFRKGGQLARFGPSTAAGAESELLHRLAACNLAFKATRRLDPSSLKVYGFELRMSCIRNYRLLLMVVALLFAAGHGHQILGQFTMHHHHGLEFHALGEVHEHEGGEHHEDEGDPEKDADHMLAHHAAVAIAQTPAIRIVVALHKARLADLSSEAMPEAPVAGIDHPPQLA